MRLPIIRLSPARPPVLVCNGLQLAVLNDLFADGVFELTGL